VVPLVKEDGHHGAGPSYVSLREALTGGWFRVTEVSTGGSVPELRVVNAGAERVLILDGEELVGAKQNRVLNTTILVDRKSELVVPVSCTEAGRWHEVSAHFADSGVVAERSVRQTLRMTVQASVVAGFGHQSDQGAVWDEVDDLQRRHGARSRTSAMRDVFASREEALERSLAALPLVEGQVGLVVLRNGDAVGIDYISRPAAYAQVHDKLLRSYLLDASPKARCASPPDLAERFLAVVCALPGRPFASPGLGTDVRYADAGLVGSALVFRGRTVHAAFFVVDGWSGRQGWERASRQASQSGNVRPPQAEGGGRMSGRRTRAQYRHFSA
jgi:hypothetical protein